MIKPFFELKLLVLHFIEINFVNLVHIWKNLDIFICTEESFLVLYNEIFCCLNWNNLFVNLNKLNYFLFVQI